VLTTVTIGQCFIYDRGTQRVHPVTWGIIGLAGLAAVVLIILAGAFSGILIWLDIIYYFSYVKIGATLLKYIPQAYFNYERKSTVGWSIGNILLDITGGILSFFQLFVDATESGNWKVFTGDPAKLALAMISIFFDILFIIQHYCLYRETEDYTLLPEEIENVSEQNLKIQKDRC